jgi:hypothetical protein
MALKRKIDKATYDALNDALKVEYKPEGADFVLDAEGFDDAAELKRAKEHEVTARKTAEAEAKRLKEKLDTITQTDAERAGDVEALEKSWKKKLTDADAVHQGELAKKDAFIKDTLVDSIALKLASDLAGDNATIILPHIKQRLQADMSGSKPMTRVLDKNGEPSALSVEELKAEFANDKRFAPVVIASKASGGGAAGRGNGQNGGAGPGNKKFSELNDQERTEWFKRDPDGFKLEAEANRRAI